MEPNITKLKFFWRYCKYNNCRKIYFPLQCFFVLIEEHKLYRQCVLRYKFTRKFDRRRWKAGLVPIGCILRKLLVIVVETPEICFFCGRISAGFRSPANFPRFCSKFSYFWTTLHDRTTECVHVRATFHTRMWFSSKWWPKFWRNVEQTCWRVQLCCGNSLL